MPIRPAVPVLILLALTGCDTPAHPDLEGVLPVSGGGGLSYRIYGAGPDTLVFLNGGPALSRTAVLLKYSLRYPSEVKRAVLPRPQDYDYYSVMV